MGTFFAFYENEKTMTMPLFPHCSGNSKDKIPLLESLRLVRRECRSSCHT